MRAPHGEQNTNMKGIASKHAAKNHIRDPKHPCGIPPGGPPQVVRQSTGQFLHNFAGGPSDGAYPFYGSLIMDKKGKLYGITSGGGGTGCSYGQGCGTVYKRSSIRCKIRSAVTIES
jgi:hypothetical protein